jgi:hypothetical protein
MYSYEVQELTTPGIKGQVTGAERTPAPAPYSECTARHQPVDGVSPATDFLASE